MDVHAERGVKWRRKRERENGKERKRIGLLLSSLDQYTLPATTRPTLRVSAPRRNPRPLCGAHPPTSPHFERTATTAFARTHACTHVHRVGDTDRYDIDKAAPSFSLSFRTDWPRSTFGAIDEQSASVLRGDYLRGLRVPTIYGTNGQAETYDGMSSFPPWKKLW